MPRHSQHSTTRAFLSHHERSKLKYGTQRQRLTEVSYRKFDDCNLCTSRAINPVSCGKGDIFCRQCAIENLLAQKEEIHEQQKRQAQFDAATQRQNMTEDDTADARQLIDFERVQAGLKPMSSAATPITVDTTERQQTLLIEAKPTNSDKKRPFEIDQEELDRIAKEDHDRHKQAIVQSNSIHKGSSSAFWVPEEVPDNQSRDSVQRKARPICPASESSDQHPISLKALIEVRFEENEEDKTRICPSCQKQLSNVTGGSLLTSCGHVVCNICMAKYIRNDARCCKCSKSFTSATPGKKRQANDVGYIELRQEGTGYAGKRDAVVSKKGIVFQG